MTRRVFVALIVLTIASLANAHPEGFSGIHVAVRADVVHATVTVHTRDTTAWFPPGKYPDYVPQVSAAMTAAPGDVIDISFDGGPSAIATNVKVFQSDVGLLQFEADYPLPPAAKAMQMWSKHLSRLPRGHQQLLFVVAGNATLLEDTLEIDHDAVIVEFPQSSGPASQPAKPPPRISFFLLGIEHIVTGYDHLLFLAALLLVCKNLREAIAVITFFTVAHSITLSLAALDIVRLPARIVEPAIAASIVYVGIENILGRHRFASRALVTFAFGLVHGLGFATALHEVGLGSTSAGTAMPLLKFSVGLETGQICIAAVLLQILRVLKKKPWFETRLVPTGSILVSAIGMYWLVTRLISG